MRESARSSESENGTSVAKIEAAFYASVTVHRQTSNGADATSALSLERADSRKQRSDCFNLCCFAFVNHS